MVAAAVGPAQRGNAFGFHRMMDNFGGALGAVLASALLYFVDLPLPTVFAASIVPGLLMDRALVPLAWLSLQLAKGLLNVPGDAPRIATGGGACWRWRGRSMR